MRFVIQRVTSAKVEIEGNTKGEIQKGFLVLIGISQEDIDEFYTRNNKAIAEKMIKKLVNMRIFEDEEGKTNLDLNAVDGEMLLISQFTLYADCKKGNRPSFIDAGEPKQAEELYNYIIEECRAALDGQNQKSRISTGEFGADMKVSLVNDGPFTIVLDSRDL